MDSTQIDILKGTLRVGLGFARACKAMRIHPREASQIILEDAPFRQILERELMEGYNTAVSMAWNLNNPKAKAQEKDRQLGAKRLKNFISNITFWGELKEEEFTKSGTVSAPEILLMKALILHRDIMEAQVACGLEDLEAVELITHNEALNSYAATIEKYRGEYA